MVLFALTGLGGLAAESKSARPNIVLILADDLGFSDLGCYGSEIPTPNLDHLAAEGLQLNQFYTTPRCCPTRAALLTGLYPQQAGIGAMMEDRGVPGYRGELNRNCLTIAEELRRADYHTAMVACAVARQATATLRPSAPGLGMILWLRPPAGCHLFWLAVVAGVYFTPATMPRPDHMPVFARNAMATRFEIVLPGEDVARLRAAAEEAFNEIERLEAQLSCFRSTSEIAHVNARAAHEPVCVSAETFRLLQDAVRLSFETGGAFDITIAPLMRAWGFVNGNGHLPEPGELAAARARVGINLVQLDSEQRTVRFARAGMSLDLGAIGKGYAVGRAADLLREAGIASALIHGGTSTVYAIGCPPDAESWRIAVEYPRASPEIPAPLLAQIELRDEALSMSAGWGKSFQANGRSYGHVLDPRTGEPADNALLTAVVMNCATETDALSTALLTLGPLGLDAISSLHPGLRALVVATAPEVGRFEVASRGVTVLPYGS